MELELFSTVGCHLCGQAEQMLLAVLPQAGRELSCYVVDIADDDALVDNYGTRIPVLIVPGTGLELAWPFDEVTLLQFLQKLG